MEEAQLGTVLVVGGSGFLGSHIVDRLLSGNHATNIVITSRNPKPHSDPRVSWHATEIASSHSVEELFEKVQPQVVIHTASPPPRSHASVLHEANITGTINLLDSAKNCSATRAFVYTSSDSAVHPSPFKQITEDESVLYTNETAPNEYAKTKAIAEKAVLAVNCYALKTATLRLPAIYGERDTNFIPQIVASVRKDQHRNQVGTNEKMFEFVFVESAAEAHILAAKALISRVRDADGQAYFITDGVPQPFFDFMRKCYAVVGHPVAKEEIKIVPFWLVRTMASVGEWVYWVATMGRVTPKMRRDDIEKLDEGCWWSVEKAKRVLGYKPVVEQDEAVRRSMLWGMENC